MWISKAIPSGKPRWRKVIFPVSPSQSHSSLHHAFHSFPSAVGGGVILRAKVTAWPYRSRPWYLRMVGTSRKIPYLVMLVETVKEVEMAEEDMVRERFQVVWDLFAGPIVMSMCGCCVRWRGSGIKNEYNRV